MPRNAYWYPAVPEVLEPVVDKMLLTYGSHRAIAAACRVSTGKLSQFLNGKSLPEDLIAEFCKKAFPNSITARRTLEDDIQKAAAVKMPVLDTLRKKIKANVRLNLTTIDYEPIAGSSECFFEVTFSRFLDLAGIRFNRPQSRAGFTPEEYKDSDFSLGLFDRADRTITLERKFWRVPIRMGTNCVMLKKYQDSTAAIANSFSVPGQFDNARIRPIIVENDAGWWHCVNRLRLPAKDLLFHDSLDICSLANRLLKSEDHSQIHVICTDEFSCIKILCELKDVACCLFPINSRRTWQDDNEIARRELPQFYCSIAIDSNDRDGKEFIQDALEQFLSTEIETTAHSWSKLAVELARQVSRVSLEQIPNSNSELSDGALKDDSKRRRALCAAYAWEWVFYTLNLDRYFINSYPDFNGLPWRPILQRARLLVQKHLAQQENLLETLVDLFWNETDNKCRLYRLLDISLGSEFRNISKSHILFILQRELNGANTLPVRSQIHDPNTSSRAAMAMRRFMRSLQNVYDGIDYADAVSELREQIDEMTTGASRYSGRAGAVILAHLLENGPIVGGACVLHHKQRNKCELRYLWVDRQYRGYNVGKDIIEKAVEYSMSAHSAKSIYVELLDKELMTAAGLFRRQGFVDLPKPSERGRAVLERSL